MEGKVVVITGASSGLGEATSRLLCAQGAHVVLGARRADRIQSLADELTGRDGKALAIPTDVTDRAQVKRLVDAAVQTYGRIDVSLIADRPPLRAAEAGAAFATPTIVHFGAVLLLSGVLRAPWQAITPAAALWGLAGLSGVAYAVIIARRMRVQPPFS